MNRQDIHTRNVTTCYWSTTKQTFQSMCHCKQISQLTWNSWMVSQSDLIQKTISLQDEWFKQTWLPGGGGRDDKEFGAWPLGDGGDKKTILRLRVRPFIRTGLFETSSFSKLKNNISVFFRKKYAGCLCWHCDSEQGPGEWRKTAESAVLTRPGF